MLLELPILRQTLVIITATIAVLMNTALGLSQDPPTASPDSRTSFPESVADELPPGTHLIFKDPASGKQIALPGFSTQMLQSLRSRAEAQIGPLYDIQQLTIDGTVTDDFARLTVQAWIQIAVQDEWVSVPLAFDEFQFLDPVPTCEFTPSDHPPPAASTPAAGKDDSEGSIHQEIGRRFYFIQDDTAAKSFRLLGKGTHQITFHVIGQVRTSNERRRLKLDVPAGHQSRLTLKIPELIDDVSLSVERPIDQRADPETATTEIETWGLASKTELSWTRRISNIGRPTTIRQTAPTRMKLDLTTQPPTLTAVQPIQISGAPVDSLRLTVPSGYADLSASAATASGQPFLLTVADRDNEDVSLEFDSPASGAMEITYSIEYASAADWIVVRPPDLEQCESENADLDLLVPAGLPVDIRRTGKGSVKQTRTDTTATARATQTSQVAYRMLSAESELTLRVEETAAFYSVAPTISFETEEDSLLMTASFSVNVLRGSVNSVSIFWPGYQDWQLLNDYTELVSGAETMNVLPTQTEDDQFQLEFPERQSRQFVVKIEAFTSLEAFQNHDVALTLPDLSTATAHSATVSLLNSDEHSMTLTSAQELTEFRSLPTSRWPSQFLGSEDSRTVQLVADPSLPVKLLIKQQRSETKTHAVLNVSLEKNAVRIQQVLSYDVRYRDIDEIMLNTAPGITPTVRLKSTAERLQERSSDQQTLSYLLPKPARGQFDVLIDYFVPLDIPSGSAEFDFNLPLVIPATLEPTLESIQILTDEIGRLDVQSSDWNRVYSDSAALAWVTRKPVDSAPLIVRTAEPLQRDQAELLILKSAVMNDTVMSSTIYVLPKEQNSVRFRIPEGAQLVAAGLNDRPSEYTTAEEGDQSEIELRSSFPIDKATVVIQHSVKTGTVFDQMKPQFAEPVGVSDNSVCLWLVRGVSGSVIVPANSEIEKISFSDRQMSTLSQQVLSSVPLSIPEAQKALLVHSMEEALADSQFVSAFTGLMLRNERTVYVLSRQTILLCSAILGILTYLLLVSLRMLPLLSVTTIVVGACVVVVALVPPAAYDAIFQIVPGCLLAAVAAVFERYFGRGFQRSSKEAVSRDNSTIFAIDQPAGRRSTQSETDQAASAISSRVS